MMKYLILIVLLAQQGWCAGQRSGHAQRTDGFAQGIRGTANYAWTPPSNAYLNIWFDGFTALEITNGVLIDASGNGNNGTQTVANLRGSIVDGTAIKGDGSSTFWELPRNVGTSVAPSNFTVIIIGTQSSVGNTHFYGVSEYANANWDDLRIINNTQAGWRGFHDTAESWNENYASSAGYQLYAYVYSLNNARIYKGTTLLGSTASANIAFTGNITAHRFLAYGNYFTDASYKLFMLYRCALTTNDIASIKAHYGL